MAKSKCAFCTSLQVSKCDHEQEKWKLPAVGGIRAQVAYACSVQKGHISSQLSEV